MRARHLITPLALTAALALSGCSSEDPEPKRADPSSTTTSGEPASSDTTPSPDEQSPPPIPEAATAHTKAGAKAFLTHYLNIVNYAQKSLDPAPLRELNTNTCDGCAGGVDFIVEVKTDNGTIIGGNHAAENMTATAITADHKQFTKVDFDWVTTPQKVTYPNAKKDSYPGGRTRGQVILKPTTNGWKVNFLVSGDKATE